MLPLPLIVTANAAVGRRWAQYAIAIIAGVASGIVFLLGALDAAGAGTLSAGSGGNQLGLDAGFMATGLVAATLTSKPLRERIASVLPLDPDNPVHALALVLAAIFFGTQVSTILFTSLAVSSQSAVGIGDLIAQDVGFLILAAAGVGIFMRRDVSQSVQRLGLVRPAWWHVALGLAAAGLFVAFGQAMDELSRVLTPSIYNQVQTNTNQLFGGLVSGPIGVAAIALAPGIGEEVLFRGALQPRIGLIATALLFASFHSQYGLSFDTVAVFAIALGLGLIRKYTSTTTSAITHVSYNLVIAVGLSGSGLYAALAIEAILVGAAAYGIWSARRRTAQPVDS